MLKKVLLLIVLAIQFAAVANISVNHVPWPECTPDGECIPD